MPGDPGTHGRFDSRAAISEPATVGDRAPRRADRRRADASRRLSRHGGRFARPAARQTKHRTPTEPAQMLVFKRRPVDGDRRGGDNSWPIFGPRANMFMNVALLAAAGGCGVSVDPHLGRAGDGLQHPGTIHPAAAGAVQPQAPRQRSRHRLPLLPHLGRDLAPMPACRRPRPA